MSITTMIDKSATLPFKKFYAVLHFHCFISIYLFITILSYIKIHQITKNNLLSFHCTDFYFIIYENKVQGFILSTFQGLLKLIKN